MGSLLCDISLCFCQVWCLIVSIPDICLLLCLRFISKITFLFLMDGVNIKQNDCIWCITSLKVSNHQYGLFDKGQGQYIYMNYSHFFHLFLIEVFFLFCTANVYRCILQQMHDTGVKS